MYTGPNLTNDNLVFGYDTGYGVADNITSTRFYPGKNTSNSLETDANWTYPGTNITSPDDLPIPLPEGVKFNIASKNSDIRWTDACQNYTGSYSAGTNITVSGWHMFHTTDTSLTMNSRTRLGWHYSKDGTSTYGGTIYTATEWNKWYYFSHTFSSTGVTTQLRVEDGGYDYYLSTADAAKTTQYYCNLQVEVGTNIPSPFTDGTRSSTQSLIDLTKTTDIDVSSVSFDSTGQPSFDGTDDYIQLGNILNTLGSQATFDMVFKSPEANDAYRVMIGWGYGNSNYSSIALGNLAGAYSDESAHVILNASAVQMYVTGIGNSSHWKDNKFHHMAVTIGKNNYSIWIDGIERSFTFAAGSQTTTLNQVVGYNSNITAQIGQRPYGGGGGRFNGSIPVMRVHNKILTAEEIKTNYKAYKNRFNL